MTDRHRQRLALEARIELAVAHADRLARDGITTTAYVAAVHKVATLRRRLEELDGTIVEADAGERVRRDLD